MGKLTLIKSKVEKRGNYWFGLYQCECGETKLIRDNAVDSGNTKSCGCLHNSRPGKHGLSTHPLYRKLANIITRCTNPKVRSYKYYGAKGIHVCKEWVENRGAFVKWALENGWKPGLTIDRIDNRLSYYPSNCRFVTQAANNRNKYPSRPPRPPEK